MENLTVFNSDLIPVYTTDTNKQVVLGRELHDALEIKTNYKDWFPRMVEYGFTEGEDFNSLKNEQVRKEGNRMVTREILDHVISFDMAKHIAMIQRSEKGKLIRQKLIDLEKVVSTGLIQNKIDNKKLDQVQDQINSLSSQLGQVLGMCTEMGKSVIEISKTNSTMAENISTVIETNASVVANSQKLTELLMNLVKPQSIENTVKESEEKKLDSDKEAEDKPKKKVSKKNDPVRMKVIETINKQPKTLNVTKIAEQYGLTARQFNKVLADLKIQYKDEGGWRLNKNLDGKELVKYVNRPVSDDNAYQFMVWSKKSRLYLYDFLKQHDLVPLNER